ncbi:MAG: SusC/RagA family TonB-linked outer membrane protein [Mucilaginibacter sp.]
MKRKFTLLIYLTFLCCMVLCSVNYVYAQDQSFTFKGRVVDEKGNALPGATVKANGTKEATTTDVNGAFSIKLSGKATLTVSFVGFVTQNIEVGSAKNNITITLSESGQQLNDVVVVGYGTQRRADITGAIADIPKARLSQLPATNILQNLEGAVAGVTISTQSSIPGMQPTGQVRGRNSIGASNLPYVVVDGIPLSQSGGSLNDISPNDIASMEILKDPSAVAIYGANGSNGVILITTKRGKTGKPVINYNGYAGPEGWSHVLTPRTGPQYIQKYADYMSQTGQTQTSLVPNYSELPNYQAGKTIDWLKAISQNGFINDNNLNISGGSENVKYFVSGDYMKQQGVIKGYQYHRVSFRSNLDVNLTSFLTVGTNIYYANNNTDGGQADMELATQMSPYGNEYNANGTYAIYPMYPELLYTNPMLGLTTTQIRRVNDLSGNGYAEVKFGGVLKGLKYRLNAGYNYVPTRNDSYAGRLDNVPLGSATTTNAETNSYTIDNLLYYIRDFGKNHIDFTGLYSSHQSNYLWNTANATGFINDADLFYNLSAGATQSANSSAYSTSLRSQMARLVYSYDNRYVITLTGRRDGASVFGASTSKYGFFPAAAFSWIASNESFMHNVDWINTLKLRASYGKTGNEAISPYQTITQDGTVKYPFEGTAVVGTLNQTRLGNPNLHWESTAGINVGIDFGILKDRINGSIDLYKTTTTGEILLESLPAISGYSNVYENIGKVGNKGIDITLNTRNINGKDFRWESTIVFNANKNQIIDLYGNKQSDLGNRWFIGQPISVIYDYKKIGVWQTSEAAQAKTFGAKPGDLKFADLNGDGHITPADMEIQGQTTPKWTGGLTNTFHYKNVSLSIFIQTAQGMMRNNADLNYADESGRRNTPQAIGYWTPSNNSNTWQSLAYTNPLGYGYPVNASYTRIKDVTLSYVFSKNITDKLGLGGLTVYASGRNLYTFTKWIGWDPEQTYYPRGTGGYTPDGTYLSSDSNYPLTRDFIFGVNVSLK